MTLIQANVLPIGNNRHVMNICEQNIGQFLFRHLDQWSGLSANCKESEIIALFCFNEGEGVTHCGLKNVEYRFRSLPFKGFLQDVYFYFARDQLSHIATEFWSFDRRECADILRLLGEPAHRLEFAWKEQTLADSELLYPDKGIAIGVIPETGLIASVKVFCPCTEQVYKESYWNTKHSREFPPQ
jgi:hypothetical protein